MKYFKRIIKFFIRRFNGIWKKFKRQIIKQRITSFKIPALSGEKNKKPQYIVTLTSYGQRISTTAPYAIFSLLNQSVLPDRIVLVVSSDVIIPPVLECLSKKGVEILFHNDLGPYTKLVPALLKFPEDILVTADDDVYYPKNWFKQLKTAYLNDSTKIHCHRAHEICFDNNKILAYRNWKHSIKTEKNNNLLFPTGVGGILYPPYSLHESCVDISKFTALAPKADDIWFWAMAKIKGTKHSLIRNGYSKINHVDLDEESKGLLVKNFWGGENDNQLQAVIGHLPILMDLLLKNK